MLDRDCTSEALLRAVREVLADAPRLESMAAAAKTLGKPDAARSIVDTLMESTTKFVMNKDSHKDEWKKDKVDRLVLMLRSAMAANGKVGLMMNVPKSKLSAVMEILPKDKKPTIAELSDKDWVDLSVIMEEKMVRDIAPDLKRVGAEDIVEYPLNKIIH